ncbi:hypothetical protein CPB86DRAFT_869297 [Serendipita vermifera]|nr:hypothetical protein CPB86DRAFT_869297 [Serendipita vermifera]
MATNNTDCIHCIATRCNCTLKSAVSRTDSSMDIEKPTVAPNIPQYPIMEVDILESWEERLQTWRLLTQSVPYRESHCKLRYHYSNILLDRDSDPDVHSIHTSEYH